MDYGIPLDVLEEMQREAPLAGDGGSEDFEDVDISDEEDVS